jgi:quaternary ammonium compound-resistance protein SugE
MYAHANKWCGVEIGHLSIGASAGAFGAIILFRAIDWSRDEEHKMHWIYLGIAVLFEIAVAISAGKADGFRNWFWTAATLISGICATLALSFALLTFDVGVGYAMWTSIAGVGIVAFGAAFGERLNWKKAGVILGVIGLRLSGAA